MSKKRITGRDNITLLWTPQDSIDTARHFHLETDNAERGAHDDVEIADPQKMREAFDPQPRRSWLLTQGRERKAKLMDALAVVLLFLLMGALGAATLLLVAPKAKADIDPIAVSYAAHYADAICTTLAGHPTNAGVQGIIAAIREDGLTNLQAAGAVVLAVTDVCPQQRYVLDAFVDRWEPINTKDALA